MQNFGISNSLGIGEVSVASAATVDLGALRTRDVLITGATTITSFGTTPNRDYRLRFSGALTLTHNATTLILPGAANLVTVAGDTAVVESDTSGNWRVTSFQTAPPAASVEPGWDLIIRDEKAQGTAGGSSVAGLSTRTLNTVSYTNSKVTHTLSANVVTINTPGRYLIRASAPAVFATNHNLRVSRSGTEVLRGANEFASNTATVSTTAIAEGIVALTAGQTIRLDHRITAAQADFGLGLAVSNGIEVYATLMMKRIGA